MPLTGDHPMHPFVIDAKGDLFVDSGSATNSCQSDNRMPVSPGIQPCTELQTRAGTWRYEADKTGRDNLEKAELLQLLTQRIAELPDIPKKILAMYYFENMRLAEIASVFGLTESRICQIHAQTILGLRAWIQRVRNK